MATRGHWPRGKRRHAADLSVIRDLRDAHAVIGSYRLLGKAIGVDDKTVKKWVTGLHVPSPVLIRRLRKCGFGA